ncbi:MAG: hypothetical protein U9O98_05510 [Asgard group archaeon]|nr:hypothetical protein [Asgard group archaeon]
MVSLSKAQHIAKTGNKLLISIIIIDLVWLLIRYLVRTLHYSGVLPESFSIIETFTSIAIFTIGLTVFCIGVLCLGLYYLNDSLFGLISGVLLGLVSLINISHIIILIINLSTEQIPKIVLDALSLTSSVLFLSAIGCFVLYLHQIKTQKNIGIGAGIIPLVFIIFGTSFPITTILKIVNISFQEYNIIGNIVGTLLLISTLLEILVNFDLLRRIDHLNSTPVENEKRK